MVIKKLFKTPFYLLCNSGRQKYNVTLKELKDIFFKIKKKKKKDLTKVRNLVSQYKFILFHLPIYSSKLVKEQ